MFTEAFKAFLNGRNDALRRLGLRTIPNPVDF